jgi:alcohol dehydrogenase YqhD (iron-dependent ADH family)
MENFVFQNPTKILFGKGMISHLGDETLRFGNRILLCTGKGSVKKIGLYDEVLSILKERGCSIFEVDNIESNPKMDSVYKGAEICRQEKIDLVLAVGGGSCIDGAKAIAAAARVDGDAWDFFLKSEDIIDAVPLACILTLPATGTEMNGNSVISRWDTREKIPIYGPAIYPVFSILDPEYTYSVPVNHTVNGNIDIIIHSLEQYFTHTPDVPMQDRITEGVVKTMVENTFRIMKDPRDYGARANVMFTGTVANNHWIGVGKEHDWASHKIEHELSALHDIPHGAGLAVIYPNWMKYAMQKGPARFAQFAREVWGIAQGSISDFEVGMAGAEKMREFFTKIGAPATLSDLGIDASDIPHMARQAVRCGPLGSYRVLEYDDVVEILNMCR